jgi:hypothetical protein
VRKPGRAGELGRLVFAKGHMDGEAKLPKPSSKHRQKTYEVFFGLQNQLTVMSSNGFEQFMVPKENLDSPARWPRLSVASDQGGDMMCGWTLF